MTNHVEPSHEEFAQQECYGLLNSAEFNKRVSLLSVCEGEVIWVRSSLKTLTADVAEDAYPAFQLNGRLNHLLLSKVRDLYRFENLSEVFVWDFLRSRHKCLGGKTGVDFLLGYFSPEIAAMTSKERDDHFLDLIQEEIGRLLQ